MKDPCSLDTALTIEEALARIFDELQEVAGDEQVALKNALGRVLAQPVHSPIDIPHARNAAMDGYALRSSDIKRDEPFSLHLAGKSWAGKPYQGQLSAGQCIRIFTGAVVPLQADSIVMQELAETDGPNIRFPANLAARQHIREAGEDIRRHELLAAGSKKLRAMDLALLAAAGIYEVTVKRRIRIAYFSTGDELCAVGRTLESGKIYDSNRYSLGGLLTDPCYRVADMGRIADDREMLERCVLDAANHCDVIITTGGASVGEADFIKEILERCGKIGFWKIAVKPGKPLAFGKIRQSLFFGLSGNPVSVFVSFRQIVEPALMRLSGTSAASRLRLKAVCTSRLKKQAGRQEFQRGILTQDENGEFLVESSGSQGANILSSMSRSQCYIVLPPDCEGIEPGETVTVEPFGEFF
ncbi:MAG: molybdopterin molybdotransferase MoeA [Gammaproteobacteria bacterium]